MKITIIINDLDPNEFKNLNLNEIIQKHKKKIKVIKDDSIEKIIIFIENNYFKSKNNKIKGTDLYKHYKEEVKNPLGRDNFYHSLNKIIPYFKYRKIICFNLKRKD